ncbi:hypothetical protein GUITHDRAFT_147149 [Guillardia theta CCMP2712]|uniref:peptide chain release factor N(5)-glutamine methyltransferase n=1 Tax=Guillardia theta (strain CCMP2712) TaxID=905079 RepID=L1IF46_GUITC|nr:hypothetical protein GUITHDRAFT_147149 [Guillardia theta CCMP2712]EKX34539.1 hypothetical protein GUITHDRAFT_147149 [Guillardia theta CCMP2712]|eukprot:XP_005821519.1 hypothetical protein GUITHDRAFT_147149 [Guillardia theta CCMP2712]
MDHPSDDFRTIAEARAYGIACQLAVGVEESEAESTTEILLEEVLELKRAELRRRRDTLLSAAQRETLRGFLERRRSREPVQYIVGHWPFYNLEKLLVRRPTLIPRPETEELVELVLRQFEGAAADRMPKRMMEIGPGTGAISIALLKQWKKFSTSCLAIELCDHAVTLTRENSRLHGLQESLEVILCDFRLWVQNSLPIPAQEKFDLLVSNPPYIPSDDMLILEPEVSDYEDRAALHGGEDGMDLILCILRAARV